MTMYSIVDICLLLINVVITIISAIGAYKSRSYSKKSKIIEEYNNIHLALSEIDKMLRLLPKAYGYRNEMGVNYELKIKEIGKDLYNSYQSVKASVPVELIEELNKIEIESQFELLPYINSFINGTVICNNTIDEKGYNTCLRRLMEMQYFLKTKLDRRREDLK